MVCKFARSRNELDKWVKLGRYLSHTIINKKLVAIFLKPCHVKMRKPYAAGFSVLENSKWLMFDTFYNKIRPVLPHSKVLFTDTDSFIIEVKSSDVSLNPLDALDSLMDYSNYPIDHPKHDDSRRNQIGYFKDELKGGGEIREFVGLRSKTYAFTIEMFDRDNSCDTVTMSRCKGVRKGYRKSIPFDSYKQCLRELCTVNVVQYNIQSTDHKVKTLRQKRRALGSFDDKRWLYNCGLHSRPYHDAGKDDGQCPECSDNPILHNEMMMMME